MRKKETHILSFKIILLLGIVIFTIIGIYSIIFQEHYRRYDSKVLGEENIRTLTSVETSLATVVKNANEYSKMVLADNLIQQEMASGDLFDNISEQSEIIHKLYSIFQFSDYIEAIWLIDEKGQKLTVGSSADISVEDESKKYEELRKSYGAYKLLLNGTGRQKKLSLVRSYNMLDDFRSVGIIGVDIGYEVFDVVLSNIVNEEDEQIAVLNEKNEVIYQKGKLLEEAELVLVAEKITGSDIMEELVIGNEKYLLGGVRNQKSEWKIIRYMPVQRHIHKNELVQFNIWSFIIIGMIILICAAAISAMLTKPIQELLQCMKESEHNELVKIDKKPLLGEFRVLFNGYNQMVDQIKLLIQSAIDKQRRIRQVELNEIQEQMKPHFLYNTLDSIQALAMMGDSEKVCKLVETLGDFYRKSVSGGRELLTVREEFKIAQDYVEIMLIRFGNSFEFSFHVDEECEDYMLPKLTIQPLVENAFQHGIRAKEQFGKISASAVIEKEKLHIRIADNGEGIPERIIEELASTEEPEKGKSLGLRGTIERLRLLYGEMFSYHVENHELSEIHLFINIKGLRKKENE